VKENFKALGLTLNLQPRMLQSKEGSKITDEATKVLAKNFYNEEGDDLMSEDEIIQTVKEPAPVVDLNEIFPEIKPESECPFELTGKKLGFEEDTICKKLIARYGDDYSKMSKDIKLNYL